MLALPIDVPVLYDQSRIPQSNPNSALRKLQESTMTLSVQFHSGRSLLASATIAAAIGATIATGSAAQFPRLPATHVAQAVAPYGNLPLSFEANQGQTDPSVQFLVHGQGYTLFLRSGEAILALQPAHAHSDATAENPIVRIKLAGADLKAPVIAEGPQITRTNYFLGKNPMQWRTDIPNFSRVRYRSIYEGIDLVYYGNQRRLEHDFVIAPNAHPSKIILSLSGAENPRLDPASGDLILSVSADSGRTDLRLLKPISYQESNGRRTEIPTSYQILANNKISFSIASYDHSQPLIIDPVYSPAVPYSTYLGGTGSNGNGDRGNGIAVDSAGNAYVVGTAYSTNFPLTTITFQNRNAAPAGTSTAFVTKLNPAGTALVYSTYFGGTGGDAGYGIALDSANNAYITGTTYSTDFPVTCDAFQTANPSTTSGAPTAFVARINATGNDLGYATYLGGSGNAATPAHGDVSQAIAVDSTGSAYVTGYTWSPDFPTTAGAVQPDFAGSATVSNAFVAKLNPAGKALTYATYLGGSGSNGAGDYGNAMALDSSGDAFITGSTASTDFPITTGALETSSASVKAFVTELNPAGTKNIFSTYLGGTAGDSANAIAVDSSGNVYVAGNTNSSDFPTTSGVLEPSSYWIGPPQGFVSKLKPGGAALAYSTYLEGQGTTIAALAVDASGTAYIAGSAPATYFGTYGGFVATGDNLNLPGGPSSAFIVKLGPSASVLNYASLLGGSASDAATALALDSFGNIYLTGIANSTDFPVTGAPFQGSIGAPNGSLIPTTLTVLSQQFYCSLQSGGFTVDVNLMVNSNATGPAPTGTVSFIGSFVVGETAISVSPASNGTATVALNGTSSIQVAQSATWEADYTGDSTYAPSSLSGETDGPGNCDSEPFASRRQAIRPNQGLPLATQLKSTTPASTALPANTARNSLRANNLSAATGSNAFITKFALAGETATTVYPPPIVKVSTQITTFTADYQGSGGCNAADCPNFVVTYYALVSGQLSQAAPTGTVTFTGPDGNTSGKVTLVGGVATFNGEDSTSGGVNPNGATITAAYSGDQYDLPSSATATMTFLSSNATSITLGIGYNFDGPDCEPINICVQASVTPAATGGPPLTGCFDLDFIGSDTTVCYPDNYSEFNGYLTNTGGFLCADQTYLSQLGYPSTLGASASYYSDSDYSNSTGSTSIPAPSCEPSGQTSRNRPVWKNQQLDLRLPLIPRTGQASGLTVRPLMKPVAATETTLEVLGPKFTPSPAISRLKDGTPPGANLTATETASACLVPGQTATPEISPAGGTYESQQTVTISDRTPDSTIYYTTNGTTPTSASLRYTGPFLVRGSLPVQTIAYAPSIPPSSVASATYTFDAAAPVFNPPGGTYPGPLTVTITSVTPTADIAYTPSSRYPSVYAVYTGPITISASGKYYALAQKTGFTRSSATQAVYTIELPAATPAFSIATGTYIGAQTVTITDATPGATIYYTTDGTTPTTSSAVYTGSITVSAKETLEAIAMAAGYTVSAAASAAYTIQPSTTSELQFVPVTPCRIADTRNPAGAFGGPELAAAANRTFNIPQSDCGIPVSAAAYSLNVTVVPDQSLGYLTLWPAGQPQPNVSTLNSDGRVKANAAITPAGANGGVSVFASDATQFILGIDGYFVPAGTNVSGLEFYPLTACRVADTRNANGTLGGPFLTANTSRDFPLQSGACGIPATAAAYSLNVTAVPHGSLGYLTAWPSGQPQPLTSTLNAATGAVAANAAVVAAGSLRAVSIFVSGDADVILDVNGYFASPGAGGLSLYTVTPCRAVDTRSSSGAFDGLLAVAVQASTCAPPAEAQAYVLNATVLPPGGLSYLTLWGGKATQPDVSTLNADDGAITSNLAFVATTNGTIDAFSTDSTQLILDLVSYFAP
jgi:hypothetical protein